VAFSIRSLFGRRGGDAGPGPGAPAFEADQDALPHTDGLTGLPGPAALGEEVAEELERAERHGQQLSLALIDLDGFARLNRERGRKAGDRLLKRAAAAWRSELRGTDMLLRYADDEFLVLLPNCTPANAYALVDRLVRALPRGQTCSAGLAHRRGGDSVRRLVDRASEALYDAKQAGLAQVVAR
jgi:diguanylate cyclase (GGDEF)-like protein